MKRVTVTTDSNSGITQEEAKTLGIRVLPMPFMMDGTLYYEDITLSQEAFYTKLGEGASISTSSPSVQDVMELWDELLQTYDEIVHIPMSSGLSSSFEMAHVLADEYGGRVQVADNKRISVTQKQSVLDALTLAEAGRSCAEIKEILETNSARSSIYITVDTLQFLKKGGRITPAAATIGTILNIKPVLQIQGARLDAFARVKGMKQARRTMIDAMKKDFATRFADEVSRGQMALMVAYTYDLAAAESFKAEVEEAFPGFAIHVEPLSLSVSCHIGPGALALASARQE